MTTIAPTTTVARRAPARRIVDVAPFAAALTLGGSTLAYPAVASATDRDCATVGRQESVERA